MVMAAFDADAHPTFSAAATARDLAKFEHAAFAAAVHEAIALLVVGEEVVSKDVRVCHRGPGTFRP
jgi:hypothetical protein